MFVLLLILVVALLGLGLLNPIWWMAAAALIFGLVHYGRGGAGGWGRGGDSEYREYRDHRDRQDRWDRRYSRQRRGAWNRQDHDHHR